MLAGMAGVGAVPLLGACGSTGSDQAVRIQYQQFGSGTVMRDFLRTISDQLASEGSSISTELVPLVASEDDYFTKNELMMSSPNVTPDLVYEDTFILKSDAAAGYLRPINEYVEGWDLWEKFTEPSRAAVTHEGKIYAVPTHTDTRALWYNAELLSDAGIDQPWAPQDWDELLDDLRAIKSRSKGKLIPFNIFSGRPQGEKASMQGFEMLLYGTDSTLFEDDSQKWVLGSQGFLDSLIFLKTVFDEGLAPSIPDALNPNISETITNSWLPDGQLAVNLDGSWISQNWIEGAPGEWPEWSDVMQLAKMPTQQGQGRGWVTLAGGWSWAIPDLSDKQDQAWQVLQQIMKKENVVDMALADNQVTIRSDVEADPDYQGYSPTIDFFTELGKHAIYRPAVAAYPQVSSEIQDAMGTVMTGKSTPEEAAAKYDEAVTELVGAENVTRG